MKPFENVRETEYSETTPICEEKSGGVDIAFMLISVLLAGNIDEKVK